MEEATFICGTLPKPFSPFSHSADTRLVLPRGCA